MKIITSLATLVLVVLPLAAQTPNHREGAPFRAKLSPPHASGEVLVVTGRVTNATTGEGVAHAVLDAFQADADGHYDSEGFQYRARVLTDEQGRFERRMATKSGARTYIFVTTTIPKAGRLS